jgi:hypothetical protein
MPAGLVRSGALAFATTPGTGAQAGEARAGTLGAASFARHGALSTRYVNVSTSPWR